MGRASGANFVEPAKYHIHHPLSWINEVLYKSGSEHAHEIMRENPAVFEEVS